MKLDFATFFTDFSRQRFRCTIASNLEQKTLQRLLFIGKICFFLRTPSYASVSKNFTGTILWVIVQSNGFSLKIAAVNLKISREKF